MATEALGQGSQEQSVSAQMHLLCLGSQQTDLLCHSEGGQWEMGGG